VKVGRVSHPKSNFHQRF